MIGAIFVFIGVGLLAPRTGFGRREHVLIGLTATTMMALYFFFARFM